MRSKPLILAGLILPMALATAAPKLSIIKTPKKPAPAPGEATPGTMGSADPAMGGAAAPEVSPEHTKFFEDKIQPILADNCYKCHSVAEGKSKGGLTLDTREAALKGGDTGPLFKPGSPDTSLLIEAVEYKNEDMQMPPKSTGGKLPAAAVAALREWVKMGAPDPRKPGAVKSNKLSGLTNKARGHWSYQPLVKAPVPRVSNAAWCFTPIDAFVMQKLEEHKLVASPSADKETLIRRAYFDLIGLPPTPLEIDAFEKDETPQAFAKIVEHLLASPHYGERWGRYWLDTARYSDTVGGDQNNNTQRDYRYAYAWTYRDWVINSFNADLPYDQFVKNQLAADLLPKNDVKNLAALGFITVGERFDQNNDNINDRIDVVSKGFLGLTVACARCHDHMFDPIPQKDYYALHGIFANISEPNEDDQPLINKPDPKKLAEFQVQLAKFEAGDRVEFYKVIAEWAKMFREKSSAYLQAVQYSKRNASEADQQMRDKIVSSNQLEGQLVNYIRGRINQDTRVFGPLKMFIDLPEADYDILGPRLVSKVADNDGQIYNPLVAAKFKGFKPTKLDDVLGLYGKIFNEYGGKTADAIYQEALSAKTRDAKVDRNKLELAGAVFPTYTWAELDTESMKAAVDKWPLRMRGRGRYNFAAINELKMTNDGAPAKAMIVVDKETPKDSSLLVRGQAGVPGESVPRGFLEILSPGGKRSEFTKGSGRLELAEAVASKDNPLIARVIVNRVWMHHFGEGFVRTPDDLGVQSEKPSHPELIDYLAHWFVNEGKWSIKNLHRFIMLSKVYQSRSFAVPSNEEIDPDNRYLWRANVRRLDFEAMRDSMLTMSNQLDEEIGGQSVNLTDEPYSFRRTIYGYIDRGALPELMSNFDFSDPHMPNSKRTSTIVPQQALFLMNSPFAVDVARKIVARPEVVNQPNDVQRVQAVYKIIFSRLPKPNEIKMAFAFLGDEVKLERQIGPAGNEIAEQAAKRIEEKKKQAEEGGMMGYRNERRRAIRNEGEWVERKPLTAWESYAQALLLSNEAVYVN